MDITKLFYVLYFFCIGLCIGSFALATAWRIKKKRDFVRERSECEHCHHILAPKDLVPVFSWLGQGGKCRYCHKKISVLMPIAELIAGVFFALSFWAWPVSFSGILPVVGFVLWCLALVLLLILFFYDLQWFILPNKVIYPLWLVSAAYALVKFANNPSWMALFYVLCAVTVSAGLFYLFFIVSKGTWIGFGDVRLGFAIGLLVGSPVMAGIVLFIASVTGIIFALPGLILGSRKLSGKMPFGPLLIIGLVVTVLYGQWLIDWYTHSILLL